MSSFESSIIMEKLTARRKFNPKNKEDIAEFKYYYENNKWKSNCPFILEWPYLNIPSMLKDKIISNTI